MTLFSQSCMRSVLVLTFLQTVGQSALAQTFTDSENRASFSIASSPSPLAGFITYTFSAIPILPNTEITAIDASFSSASMNQINPNGSVATIFSDNNFAITFVGEDPLNDSQFLFNASAPGVTVLFPIETSTSLSAAFTGFTGIQSSQPIARVVLPELGSGTVDLELVVREIGVGGEGDKATFSGISFGIASVPEPSLVLAWSLLAVGAALRGHRGRRRSDNRMTAETIA